MKGRVREPPPPRYARSPPASPCYVGEESDQIDPVNLFGLPDAANYSTGIHGIGFSRYPVAVFSTWPSEGNG
jgi:hypothetical protein